MDIIDVPSKDIYTIDEMAEIQKLERKHAFRTWGRRLIVAAVVVKLGEKVVKHYVSHDEES